MSQQIPFSFQDVPGARDLLFGAVRRTQVARYAALDVRVQAEVFLKAENRQRTGSFKFRCAYLATLRRRPTDRLTTVSSGNHAGALALSGRLLGARVTVHIPEDAPYGKVASVRALGAEVIAFDRYRPPQDVLARQLVQDDPISYVSSHDDPDVIAGAATATLELLTEVPI